MKGDRDTWWITDTVEKYHNNAKPVLGNFTSPNGDGHSMVIAGYYDIKVRYKDKAKEAYKSKIYRYYTVNDGWKICYKGNYRIQYIRSDYLKGIVKLLDD